jgi:hypothetical protein
MAKPKSFRECLVAWRSLADNLAAHLDEMPQLRERQEALAALVERGLALQTESATHEARLRAANREKVLVHREGRELRNDLACGLRAALGVHNERLIAFGVPPERRDIRRPRRNRAEPKSGRPTAS